MSSSEKKDPGWVFCDILMFHPDNSGCNSIASPVINSFKEKLDYKNKIMDISYFC